MLPAPPSPDQQAADHDQPVATRRKSRSVKHFLLASGAKLAIGSGIVGAVLLVSWLARNQLATVGVNAFFASKGIPSDVTIENLQLDAAQIRDLRLGPVDKPSLTAKKAMIKWRVDSAAGLFVVERLAIDDVVLHMAIDAQGKPDFGTLAPLIEPSDGPKRTLLSNVTVSNATVFLDTPYGQAHARVLAWGGEENGWTGGADITPPNDFIATGQNSGVPFEPLRVGFALRQVPSPNAGEKPSNLIGFAARPNGQSFAVAGYEALGVAGDVSGQIALQEGGTLRLDTRPAKLRLGRVKGPGFDVAGLNVATNAIFWNHSTPWQTTGWGSIVATGDFAGLAVVSAKAKLGATQFKIGAARAQSGRMQLDYQGDIANVSGPLMARKFAATGNLSTFLRDLTKFDKAELFGKAQVTATDVVLPKQIRATLPPTTPPALLSAALGRFSSSGSFDYRFAPSGSQISLEGPLLLTGSTGLRAKWQPQRNSTPALLFTNKPDGKLVMNGLGAGQVDFDLPQFGKVAGVIDGASFGPNGWALIGRGVSVKSQTILPDLIGDLTFDRLKVNAPRRGPLRGDATGRVLLTPSGGGRAALSFDLSATPSSISGWLQGPVDGFGATLGLGGYGARAGSVSLTGRAGRSRQGWSFDGRGQVKAQAMSTAALSARAPMLNLAGSGYYSDAGQVSARVTANGSAAQAGRDGPSPAFALNTITLDSNMTINGTTRAVSFSGNLSSRADQAGTGDIRVEAAQNAMTFSGILNSGQARLSGTHSTSIGRFARDTGPSSGRIHVADVRASGPFTFEAGQQGQIAPFWESSLATAPTRLTSDLKLDARSFAAGETRLANIQLTAPLDVATSRGTVRATADVKLAAQNLTSGETRLNRVLAFGPIAVAGDQSGHMRLSTTKCLAYAAGNGTFPGEASVGALSGKICPNEAGQLAIINGTTAQVFATTQIDPLAIQIRGPTGDQRIEVGEVNGTVTTKPGGGFGLNMLASQFGFSLKMPDGTIAIIKANEAALNIAPRADGIGLQGRIGRVSSLGLPVLLSGGATADMVAGTQGLGGTFNFDEIIVKDIEKSPRFGELAIAGGGTLIGNQVSIVADVAEPASTIKMATVTLAHDIRSGAGTLDVQANDVLMAPAPIRGRPGLDIVALVPPLRGVVSDMVGVANASAHFGWARDSAVVSRANIETKGLDFSTMLGPITGFAGDINLDDILLVRTPGRQTISVGLFDPGLPIANGTVQFSLPGNNSLKLENASWPFAEGKLSVRPAIWAFRDGDQSFAIDVEDVDLAKLLRLTDVPNLEIDGKVSGVFPIEVRNGNVEIVGGRLKAREGGGVIRYTGPGASSPPPPPKFFERMRQRFFGKPPPAGADLAINALRALEYKILEITVDGRITGELQMGVILEGANQQVLAGQPFKFNIKMNVPVGQLLDNLNRLNNAGTSPEVLKEIDRVMREDAARMPVPSTSTPPSPLPPPAPPTPTPLP
jgi:hypothetical protein